MKKKSTFNLRDECETIITKSGKKWLYEKVPCVMGYDFTGYLFMIDVKKGVAGAVSLNGQLYLYSVNEKKPKLSKRLFKKTLKTLYNLNFCYVGIEPFKEFDVIPFNKDNTILVHDYLFGEVREM